MATAEEDEGPSQRVYASDAAGHRLRAGPSAAQFDAVGKCLVQGTEALH